MEQRARGPLEFTGVWELRTNIISHNYFQTFFCHVNFCIFENVLGNFETLCQSFYRNCRAWLYRRLQVNFLIGYLRVIDKATYGICFKNYKLNTNKFSRKILRLLWWHDLIFSWRLISSTQQFQKVEEKICTWSKLSY